MLNLMAGSTGLEPATSGLTVLSVHALRCLHSRLLAPAGASERCRGKWRPVARHRAAWVTVSVTGRNDPLPPACATQRSEHPRLHPPFLTGSNQRHPD